MTSEKCIAISYRFFGFPPRALPLFRSPGDATGAAYTYVRTYDCILRDESVIEIPHNII